MEELCQFSGLAASRAAALSAPIPLTRSGARALPIPCLRIPRRDPGNQAEQVTEPPRPARQRLGASSVHRSPTPGQRLGKRGRAVLRFSHGRILAMGVDSRTVVSSNLQVTSYWRRGGDDNP